MNRTIIEQPQVPGGIVVVEWATDTGYPFPPEVPASVLPGYLADPRPLSERGFMGFPLDRYGTTASAPAVDETVARMVTELRQQADETYGAWASFASARDGLVEWDGTLELNRLARAALGISA